MNKILFPVAFLFVIVSCKTSKNATSAEATFEGKLVYSLEYEDMPAEYEAYASMFPKEMTMYVKGKKSRAEQPTGFGNTITIIDSKANTMVIVLDMMGMKNAYKLTAEDMKKQQEGIDKPEIVYSEETKDIAGFTCKKAEMKSGDETTVIWFTDQIQAAGGKNFGELKGFPMEYSIKANGMTILTTVKSVSKEKISDKYFDIPEGYEVKPYSEFPSMGG